MIVAFWSNVHGQPRTTSNMVAVAIAVAMGYEKRCLVTQTHFNLNNLESYLIGNRENSKDVFLDIGLDGLASVIKLRPIDKDTIENYSIPLIKNKLTLLPGTAGGNRKVFLDDMGKTVSLLLKEIDKSYDLVFVDVNSGSDEISNLILRQAELIVVNLSQNRNVIEDYLKSNEIKAKKIFYLIGSYDSNSSYNLHNLTLMYKAFTNRNTGVIPYNSSFMDAQSEGSILKFMRMNMDAKKGSANGVFIEQIKEAANKLVKLLGDKRGDK